MILIYSKSVTARLRYISRLMFTDILGLDIAFTTFTDEFSSYQGPKLVYSAEPLDGNLFLQSSGILFEEGLAPHDPGFITEDNLPVLFPATDEHSALSFDPLAAAFYMVTRYEEYEQHRHDKYGRFLAHASVAFKGRFLEIPVVHFWADRLGEVITRWFPSITPRRLAYSFIPTIDIDHAYAFKYRNLSRTLAGAARSMMHGHITDVITRIKVISGAENDPYDTYEYISEIHKKFNQDPYYFILFADYGGDDNNIPVKHKAFRRLLHNLDRNKKIGIHPSLSSNKHLRKLDAEYGGLCQLLDRDVTASRQHFLKISFPRTYRNLIQLGITDDFSMGFASHPGFRAGIARPYLFFDITRNEITPLRIHPVILMDVTLKDYLRLNPEQSIETIHRMISMVRSVGGEFVSLCHNESFSETGRWLGWRKIYEELLRFASI